MEICRFKVYIQKDSLVTTFMDKMAEWLRRWTDYPLVSARVGFKSHLCRFFDWFYVVMDCNLQFEFSNPSSNLGKNLHLENLSHQLL